MTQRNFRGLRSARDALAATIRDERCFVLTLIDAVRLASNIFRRGHVPESGQVAYEPLSTRPIVEAIQDVDFPKEAIGRVAPSPRTARTRSNSGGVELDRWFLRRPQRWRPVKVTTLSGTSRVFFVNDAQAEARLRSAGYVDDDPGSAVLIFGNSVPPRATRSPRRLYGRTGRAEVRMVDVASLISIARTADEMFEAFTLRGPSNVIDSSARSGRTRDSWIRRGSHARSEWLGLSSSLKEPYWAQGSSMIWW